MCDVAEELLAPCHVERAAGNDVVCEASMHKLVDQNLQQRSPIGPHGCQHPFAQHICFRAGSK